MTNPHGAPIWYELLTPDQDASKAFYDAVIGWDIAGPADGPMDYRMIACGDGGFVGGTMALSAAMMAGGATPRWLFYIGVDDVDATAAAIAQAGGAIRMGPLDLDGVGRFAFCADPQGIPFYIMRGASDADSTVFSPTAMGRCAWNELMTPDQAASHAFYAQVFGWTWPDRMTMPGDMGDYVFIEAAGQTIGATMTRRDGPPPAWQFYFRAPDVEVAAQTVKERGGIVHFGPAEVPGGDRIIAATDPHGVAFGVVGPGKPEG